MALADVGLLRRIQLAGMQCLWELNKTSQSFGVNRIQNDNGLLTSKFYIKVFKSMFSLIQ